MPKDLIVDCGEFDPACKLNIRRMNTDPKFAWMTWQAGTVTSEYRSNPDRHGVCDSFHGHVTLFRLLGFGASREEAIEMAKNRNRSNGEA